jgi:histidine ammonia-lyase
MLLLNGQRLSLDEIEAVAQRGAQIGLAEEAKSKMVASRAVTDRIVEEDRVVYGVNTGFGKLSDIRIPQEQISTLQLNLVRSHCCGVGNPLSVAETRAMMLLRANVLAKGFSGARPVVAETLIAMLNGGTWRTQGMTFK